MTLIDGKAISEQVKQEIAAEVAEIVANGGKRPHLAAILVGHDGGSETYVAAKVKACEVCGFKSSLIRYEADVTEEELLAKECTQPLLAGQWRGGCWLDRARAEAGLKLVRNTLTPRRHLPGTFKGTERSICTTGMCSTPGAS